MASEEEIREYDVTSIAAVVDAAIAIMLPAR